MMMQPQQQTQFSQLIDSIIGQIKRGEQQAAFISIDRQLKKDRFNKHEKKQLYLLKGTILVQMGALGEANKILNDTLLEEIDIETILAMSNLSKDLGLLDQFLLKFKPNKEQQKEYYNLLIQSHNFQDASKQALKIYKEEGEKNQETFMEYLILSSQKEDMGGKFTEMFITKLAQLIKLDDNLNNCTHKELGQQLIKFQLKFYQNPKNKNIQKVQNILNNYKELFIEYQQNAKIALWIYQQDQTQQNYEQVLQYYYRIFNSLKINDILIDFEAQEQLVKAFYNETFELQIEQIIEPFQLVQQDQLISHIYNSSNLIQKTVQNSLANKQLILICLKILNISKNPQINEVIRLSIEFYKSQGDKYTFCTELFKAIDNIKIIDQIYNNLIEQNIQFKSKEAETIQKINLKKIQIYISKEPLLFLEELIQLYQSFPVPEKVEKGDRLIQDEYLMIAIDLLYEPNNLQKIIQSLSLIDIGLKNSPYNFDFLFRQIILYSELGLTELAIESLTRLDIKGVQFETLGFIFAKSYLEFGGPIDQVEKKNQQALMFYLENIRESKKNLITSFKTKNYVPFESFYQFEQWIHNSYLKLIYYFVQANIANSKSKGEIDVQYFFDKIQTQLQQPLTLSIQELHFQNFYIREFYSNQEKYGNYLGIIQDPQELKKEILFIQLNNQMKDIENIQILIETIKQINILNQQNNNYQQNIRNKINNIKQIRNYQTQYYNFVNDERELRINICKYYSALLSPLNDQNAQDYNLNLEYFQKILNHLENLQFETITTNQIRILYRFSKHTMPVIIQLCKTQIELKQKLFTLQKKAKGELKSILEKNHKSIVQTINTIKEQIINIIKMLIQKLNLNDPNSFIKSVVQNNLQFIDQISTSIHFLNIQIISMLEDQIKLLK